MRQWMWIAAAALAAGGCSVNADKSLAEGAIVEFRQMVDAGRFAEIYRASAQEMKSTVSEAELVRVLAGVHAFYGNFRSATQTNSGWNSSNGVVLVTLNYDSEYMRGSATERFVYRVQDGTARLVRYDLDPRAAGTTGNEAAPASAPAPAPGAAPAEGNGSDVKPEQ